LAAVVDGVPVAFVRTDEATARSALSLGTTGLAGPATGTAALADTYDDARACVRVLEALGRNGSIASPADLGLPSPAQRLGPRGSPHVRHPHRGPAPRHDEDRGTDLARTAEVFLRAGRRKASTAKERRLAGR
jgi:hypothetical protein